MRRLLRILLNITTVVSLLLCVATAVLWVRSYQAPWVGEIIRDRGDFRIRMSSDAGLFRIGETHHFEEWRIAHWKLCVLFAIPMASRMWGWWKRRIGPALGRCPSCGYDLRATPDRCPECGTVR